MNPKYLMDTFGLEPKKSLGQNFLHDPNALEKIVSTAEITAEDTIIEIGPGTGALTVHLAQTGARVFAIEIDERLFPILERQLSDFPNVELIHADILTLDLAPLVGDGDYMVVANLPYYITSPIMQHLLDVPHKPKRLVLTMQQEVAERIVAQPGDLSLLAISVQFYGLPRIASKLNPAVFWPRPEVGSAVLRIDVYDQPKVNVPNEENFFKVVRAGFGQKRKQIKNSLGAGLSLTHAAAGAYLESAGIDPTRRAETLSLDEWAALTWVMTSDSPPPARPQNAVSAAYMSYASGNMHKSRNVTNYAQVKLGKVNKKNW